MGEVAERSAHRRKLYLCRCDCGVERTVVGSNLRTGTSKSCGCYKSEVTRSRKYKHGRGLSDRTYRIWSAMRGRCNTRGNHKYYRYGGRGISVCGEWVDFPTFLRDMGEAPANMSIDRIDNDGDYTPSNCRWATASEQARNRSDNVWLEFDGRNMILSDWAIELNIDPSVLTKRFTRGWSIRRALRA